MGMVGVGVNVGSGVSVGIKVWVGMGVSVGRPGVVVMTIGVCVAAPPAGRLQASIDNAKTRLAVKVRLFIKLFLLGI